MMMVMIMVIIVQVLERPKSLVPLDYRLDLRIAVLDVGGVEYAVNPKCKRICALLTLQPYSVMLFSQVHDELPILLVFLFHRFDIVDGEALFLLDFQFLVEEHPDDVVF